MGRKKNHFEPCNNAFAKPMFYDVASAEDLARLDDAIHNHNGKPLKEFEDLLRLAEASFLWGKPWNAEARIRTTTLRHCWVVLRWRPCRGCKYVYVKEAL